MQLFLQTEHPFLADCAFCFSSIADFGECRPGHGNIRKMNLQKSTAVHFPQNWNSETPKEAKHNGCLFGPARLSVAAADRRARVREQTVKVRSSFCSAVRKLRSLGFLTSCSPPTADSQRGAAVSWRCRPPLSPPAPHTHTHPAHCEGFPCCFGDELYRSKVHGEVKDNGSECFSLTLISKDHNAIQDSISVFFFTK